MAAPEQFYTTPVTPENFFVVTAPDGREFHAPTEIFVNNIDGSRHPGTFDFDPVGGRAIEKSASVDETAWLGARVIIGAYTSVEGNTIIGPGVRIGDNVAIWDKVGIRGGCVIGDNAVIERKVRIGKCSRIQSYARVCNRTELGDYSSVGPHSLIGARQILPDFTRTGPFTQIVGYERSDYLLHRKGA